MDTFEFILRYLRIADLLCSDNASLLSTVIAFLIRVCF